MNMQTLAGSLFAAAVLAFGNPAVAEEHTFLFADLIFEPWASPYDADEEPLGFRIAGLDGLSLTGFGAPGDWDDTTFVLGFTAAPETSYRIDWGNSWLDLHDGTRIGLTDIAPAPASETGEAWLAAHTQGGNGLTPETTWVFTAPVHLLDLGGGSIAYRVTSVPEPAAWAMLLAGLGVMGATARVRAKG
jgi:hypothetical protein